MEDGRLISQRKMNQKQKNVACPTCTAAQAGCIHKNIDGEPRAFTIASRERIDKEPNGILATR